GANDNDVDPRMGSRALLGKVGICSPFNSVRCQLEHPGENERDRQTDDDEQNSKTNDPVRNVEDRQDLRDSLRKCPARDDVGDGNLKKVRPLQLGKEEVIPT